MKIVDVPETIRSELPIVLSKLLAIPGLQLEMKFNGKVLRIECDIQDGDFACCPTRNFTPGEHGANSIEITYGLKYLLEVLKDTP